MSVYIYSVRVKMYISSNDAHSGVCVRERQKERQKEVA